MGMVMSAYASLKSIQPREPEDVAASAREDVWAFVRLEARQAFRREPLLGAVLEELACAPSDAQLLARVLSRRLAAAQLPAEELRGLMEDLLAGDQAVVQQAAADLAAVKARDPACAGYLHTLLNLKGFHALQVHRVSHVLWKQGRTELAHWLANMSAMLFSVDIHPAARIGCGVMLDHATGIVIGETAVVEDEVSILQNVTLGGTGKEHGDRHPKIRRGVLLGAGAKVLGNIEVGMMSKVAAGSVVLRSVPPHCTVAGVPAKVVRIHSQRSCPASEMDQAI